MWRRGYVGRLLRLLELQVMLALPPCSSTVPTTFMAMVLVKGVRFAENPMALGSGIKDCNLLGEIAIFDDPRSKIQDLTRSLGTILDHKRLQSFG